MRAGIFIRQEGVCAIARALDRDPSTISRELNRNSCEQGAYRPTFADGSYLYRRQRAAILEKDLALRGFVVDRLAEGWTPEQIAGWLSRGIERGLKPIRWPTGECSHSPLGGFEAIYAFIFRAAQKAEKLWRYLVRRKATRGRRARRSKDRITLLGDACITCQAMGKTHISQRSKAANDRAEPGHWEADLVICKRNRPLLVLHERKTRLTVMTRLASKTAAETITAITDILDRLDPKLRRSMTFDNGGEFARHAMLKDAFNMTTYFCDAYASWQKGGIENTNGRIRRWFPRSTDLDDLTDEDIQDVAMSLNLTPRKCLGFKTPAEAFLNALGKTLTIRFNTRVALRG